MITTSQDFDDWCRRYAPVEDAIYADHAKRARSRMRNRERTFRAFGDLCEATEGLAKVAAAQEIFDQADGDVWTLQCLRRFLGTSGWRKLEPLRRAIRRPSYYAAENARRRALRAERRKIRKRTTLNPCPTRTAILEAWTHVRESHEAMVRFGSLVMDLECYLDNSLIISEEGAIVGRRGGVKRWLQENIPALYLRYTTVMRYKAAAQKLRQVAGLVDPVPAEALVDGRDYGADEIARARVAWLEVDEGAGKSVTALIARIDALLDPEGGGGGGPSMPGPYGAGKGGRSLSFFPSSTVRRNSASRPRGIFTEMFPCPFQYWSLW